MWHSSAQFACADRTEADHAALLEAVREGRIEAAADAEADG